MKKTRVVILFGGRSAEHEISLLSARNVLARARPRPLRAGAGRHRQGRALAPRVGADAGGPPPAIRGALALDAGAPAVAMAAALASRYRARDCGRRRRRLPGAARDLRRGRDGAGLLELADVAYVGAGVLGSAIGMDKDVTKRLLRDAGIPIVDFAVVTARRARARSGGRGCARAAPLGYPLFVKPANAGSSVGVSARRAAPGDLRRAVARGARLRRKVLLEQGVDAREIECAVLGNDDPRSLGPGRDRRAPPRRVLFVRRQVRRRGRRELADPGGPAARA